MLQPACFYAKQHNHLPEGNTIIEEVPAVSAFDKNEKILKAVADKSRLQILDCIRKDIANPGDIAKELNRHRSTVEKHLRMLRKMRIVEKVPSLTKGGQLSVRYKIRDNAVELLDRIQEACRKF